MYIFFIFIIQYFTDSILYCMYNYVPSLIIVSLLTMYIYIYYIYIYNKNEKMYMDKHYLVLFLKKDVKLLCFKQLTFFQQLVSFCPQV